MRGVYWVLAVVLLLALGLCACAGNPNPREPAQSTTQAARQESVTSGADEAPAAAQAEQPVTEAPTEPTPAETEADVQQSIPQTGMSVPVPQTYTQPAEHPGQVVALTYESRDYAGDGGEIELFGSDINHISFITKSEKPFFATSHVSLWDFFYSPFSASGLLGASSPPKHALAGTSFFRILRSRLFVWRAFL